MMTMNSALVLALAAIGVSFGLLGIAWGVRALRRARRRDALITHAQNLMKETREAIGPEWDEEPEPDPEGPPKEYTYEEYKRDLDGLQGPQSINDLLKKWRRTPPPPPPPPPKKPAQTGIEWCDNPPSDQGK